MFIGLFLFKIFIISTYLISTIVKDIKEEENIYVKFKKIQKEH